MVISTSARSQQSLISLPTTPSIASFSQWVVVEKSRMFEVLLDLVVFTDEFPYTGTPRRFGPPLVVGMLSRPTGGSTLRSWVPL